MATLKERTAEDVVELQCGVRTELMKLKNHRTVRMNPVLLAAVDQAWQCIVQANGAACVVWFKRDTLTDIEPLVLASLRESSADDVVRHQSGAIAALRDLKNHRTVQTNPFLLAAVDQAWQDAVEANALACVVWFKQDTVTDIEPFLPPAA